MIMKTITMLPEQQRKEAINKLSALVDEGRSITEISFELNIPESEIRECIELAKKHKTVGC